MSFLQPGILLGLPLLALPIIIHLVNRQRHRTVNWAAMRFLLDARRMSTGMARIRQWLILLMRMLIIAGIVMAISRPLAGLWMGGLAGSGNKETYILLDRSASMEQQNLQSGQSKRATALTKLSNSLDTAGTSDRILFIDGILSRPIEVSSASALKDLQDGGPTSTTADIPKMLESALDNIEANQTGSADIWICTDLRANDWDIGSGRWDSIRARASRLPGLRIFLLAYPAPPEEDYIINIQNVKRNVYRSRAEVLVDFDIRRAANRQLNAKEVQLEFSINGNRSSQLFKMESELLSLKGHTLPIDITQETGWGRISVPADSNPRNNDAYFVYAASPVRKTVIVSENEQLAEIIRITASSPMDRSLQYEVQHLKPSEDALIDWKSSATLIWHAPIPDGVNAKQLKNYVESGGSVIFLPPEQSRGKKLFGIQWTDWITASATPTQVGTWRTDSGLLRNTQNGNPLPLGKTQIYQHCELNGSGTPLAQFESGKPLLLEAYVEGGRAWFLSTLPQATHSSLSRDGISFYVLLHRAIELGASALGDARNLDAGPDSLGNAAEWMALSIEDGSTLSTHSLHAGAFVEKDENKMVALNRPQEEDEPKVIGDEDLAMILEGIEYKRIDDAAGSLKPLTAEIWKTFLLAASLALLAEALLCLPGRKTDKSKALST